MTKCDLALVVDNDGSLFELPDHKPLIPEGKYHFKLLYHETSQPYPKSYPKLTFWMQVADFGECNGVIVPRYYNVKRLKGKSGKKGRFVPTRSGDFLIEYFKLLPDATSRVDRLAMQPLYNKLIFAEVSTVKLNNLRKELPKQLHYSKVSRLIELRDDLIP